MGLHGASWGFMGYHGISCDFMGLFCSFFVFWCPKKIFGGTRKIKSIRDPGLSSPIPSLTKIYGGPMKKNPFQRSRALQPNPFPRQNLWRPHEKNPFKDPGLSSPIPFLTKIYSQNLLKDPGLSSPSPFLTHPFPCGFCLTPFSV